MWIFEDLTFSVSLPAFQRPVLSSELQIHSDESRWWARAFASVHITLWHQQHKTKVGGMKTFQESCVNAVLHSINKPQRLCLGRAACLKELLSLLLLQCQISLSCEPLIISTCCSWCWSGKIPGFRLLNLGQGFTEGGVQTSTQQCKVTLHHYLPRDVVNLAWWDLYYYKMLKTWLLFLYSNRHFAAVWLLSFLLR